MGSWFGPVMGILSLVIGGWFAKKVVTPKDHERAVLLNTIAKGAVSIIVAAFPKADWAKLLELSVDAISRAAGVPTQNTEAINRAAAAALTEMGKNPNAKTDPTAKS